MLLKKITRRGRIGLKILRDDGARVFLVRGLRFAEKKLVANISPTSDITKQMIDVRVKYRDALAADYATPLPAWSGTDRKNLRLNWVMLPPGKGSGGHLNIYRFIKYLEDAGHTCRIYIYTQHQPGRVSDIRALMGDSYPKLEATMTWIDHGNEMEEADAIFATSWDSAYCSFTCSSSAKRLYFVQDFEPYFYPVGSLSVLAENTYRFGFYGITAGNWLATKLKRDYGMETDYFDFGADPDLYKYQNDRQRKEVFFYARPHTERRGFELGIMALELFHKKHPDYVINLAGEDISNYDIPFPHKNLQTLEVHELNTLYNRCAAGLVLSLTNMSLLPLELLASGTIPVLNDGENNRLVSNNPYLTYTEPDPVALARALSGVVNRPNAPLYAKKAAESVKLASWDEAGRKFVKIVERETRRAS